MMVGSAKPPETTTSEPPLETMVSSAVPPDDTISVPPLRITTSLLVCPDETTATVPLPTEVGPDDATKATSIPLPASEDTTN